MCHKTRQLGKYSPKQGKTLKSFYHLLYHLQYLSSVSHQSVYCQALGPEVKPLLAMLIRPWCCREPGSQKCRVSYVAHHPVDSVSNYARGLTFFQQLSSEWHRARLPGEFCGQQPTRTSVVVRRESFSYIWYEVNQWQSLGAMCVPKWLLQQLIYYSVA